MRHDATPSDPGTPTNPSPAVSGLVVLAAGVVVELLVFHSEPGVGMALATLVGAALVIALARPRAAAVPYLAAAVVLGSFAAVRTSLPLVAFDVLGAGSLLVAGASFSRAGEPLRASVVRYASGALAAVRSSLGAARLTVAPVARLGGAVTSSKLRTLVRVLAVAVPLVVVFALLLASADPVFDRVVTAPFRFTVPPSVVDHAVGTVVAALGLATLVVAARRTVPDRLLTDGTARVGRPEWVTALAGLDVLLGVFVVIQFAYLFGGRDTVVADSGLTYAEYARSGFWQLLAVSGLTLGVVAAGWTFARRERGSDRTLFTVLSCVLIVLTLVVLASAHQRLVLYESEFGFTRLRILVHATILLLGAVLVATLVGILARNVRWVTTTAFALATATLVALNVANLDRMVAEHNLDRFRTTGKIDAAYLGSLSPDAAPALVAALPGLPADLRAQLADRLDCMWERVAEPEPWTAWNLGRDAARTVLSDLPAGASC